MQDSIDYILLDVHVYHIIHLYRSSSKGVYGFYFQKQQFLVLDKISYHLSTIYYLLHPIKASMSMPFLFCSRIFPVKMNHVNILISASCLTFLTIYFFKTLNNDCDLTMRTIRNAQLQPVVAKKTQTMVTGKFVYLD